ncbi:MAG: hypothetical protein ACP5SG_04740 [Dissulfurimicrobium sp.]|uniref:hypothetical protein n=1 Tax=Dissulfurimicrobium sp. TaxID=2022436 RepID=UPI003D0BFBA6
MAVSRAAAIAGIADTIAWASAYRLTRLVDHADLYLSLFRSNRWFKKYVSVTGLGWPADDVPFLAITFHFGAGLWSLRHLKATGRFISGLMKGFNREEFPGRFVRYCYGRLRTYAISRAGVKNLVFLDKGSYFKLRNVFSARSCLVALLDVPTRRQRNAIKASLFGRDIFLPRGLIHLAAREKIPIIAYSATLDRETGARTINISELVKSDSEEVLADYLVNELKKVVYSDTASWHCWEYVDMFFVDHEK